MTWYLHPQTVQAIHRSRVDERRLSGIRVNRSTA